MASQKHPVAMITGGTRGIGSGIYIFAFRFSGRLWGRAADLISSVLHLNRHQNHLFTFKYKPSEALCCLLLWVCVRDAAEA